jgi:hypothetical protein
MPDGDLMAICRINMTQRHLFQGIILGKGLFGGNFQKQKG